jgi:hypothetical protein
LADGCEKCLRLAENRRVWKAEREARERAIESARAREGEAAAAMAAHLELHRDGATYLWSGKESKDKWRNEK